MRLVQRSRNRASDIERVQPLHVDDLGRHAQLVEIARRFIAIAQHAPYVTTVTSRPSRSTSGTPSGTVNSPTLSASRSFKRYTFSTSTTTAGLSPRNNVLYMPAACVMLRGTAM